VKAIHTDIAAYALVLRVVSEFGGRWNGEMRTLTRLFAAGAGIVRASANAQPMYELRKPPEGFQILIYCF
jgi:hypothetical protein